jgi:hypothetical protein
MQIYKTGTEATTVIGNIKAIITAVTIRENHCAYEHLDRNPLTLGSLERE